MKKCTIFEACSAVDEFTNIAKLYTDQHGLKQLLSGSSFYVWTFESATSGDVAVLVFEKDLAEDENGYAYCVDGLDVKILGE